MDHFGLEQAVDRLGERVVIRIADAADGGLDAGLSQALGVANAHILGTSVGVMDGPTPADRLPLVECLFECIEHEI